MARKRSGLEHVSLAKRAAKQGHRDTQRLRQDLTGLDKMPCPPRLAGLRAALCPLWHPWKPVRSSLRVPSAASRPDTPISLGHQQLANIPGPASDFRGSVTARLGRLPRSDAHGWWVLCHGRGHECVPIHEPEKTVREIGVTGLGEMLCPRRLACLRADDLFSRPNVPTS